MSYNDGAAKRTREEKMSEKIIYGGRGENETMMNYIKRMLRLRFSYEGFFFSNKEYSQPCPECGELAIAEYFKKSYSRKDEINFNNRKVVFIDTFKYVCPNDHSSSSKKLDKWNSDRAINEWHDKYHEQMPLADNCKFDLNEPRGRILTLEIPEDMARFFNEEREGIQDISNNEIVLEFAKRGIESYKASLRAKQAVKRKRA